MNKIKNWRVGAFHLDFENGNHVSTTFAPGSYSDNYDMDYKGPPVEFGRVNPPIESSNVEMMITCSDKLLRKLEKKYNEGGQQPFARIGIMEMLDIINQVSKEKH